MRKCVVADFMARRGHPPGGVGKPVHVRADLEEGSRDACRGERLENGRRGAGVRAVVEGEVAHLAVAAAVARGRTEQGAVGIVGAPQEGAKREGASAGRPDQGSHGEETRRVPERSNRLK
jgi:hypothetical protein